MWQLLILSKNHLTYTAQMATKIVVVLLALLLVVSTVQAAPPAQDPRGNNNENNSGGGASSSGGDKQDEQDKPPTCAALKGQVLNWGFGPQPDVTVILETGSWQVSAASATDGSYGFGGLGVGIAKLHVALPPGLAETLKPLTQDAGVYLSCDFPTIANLAVYSNDLVQPPATISASVSGRFAANSEASLHLVVKNNLPTPITNVIITDLMGPGLIPLAVQAADAQVAQILDGGPDGHLVAVYLDSLASGAEANVVIIVTADPELPAGTMLNASATLFYRESVAHQANLDFIVGQNGEMSPIAASVTASQTHTMPALATETATAVDVSIPPTEIPTTGEAETMTPPPDLLPTTGDFTAPPPLLPETGVGLWLPISGLGLMGLAFLAHLWRTSGRRRE